MPTPQPAPGAAHDAPGLARHGPRAAVARVLPARVSLPLRAYVGRSREPELALLRTLLRPGQTAVDIGAHTGVYTHWMRRWVGRSGTVLAYEPQPRLRAYLEAGLARRCYRNVQISGAALSDQDGHGRLTIPVVEGARQVAWAKLDGSPGEGEQVEVVTTTLDAELGDRPVALVKCDVEGHESKVLGGASYVLSNQRPTWLVEIEHRHAGEAVAEALRIFDEHEYSVSYLTSTGAVAPVPGDHLQPSLLNCVEPRRYVNNFLFQPR